MYLDKWASGGDISPTRKIVYYSTVHRALEQRIFFKEAIASKKAFDEITIIAPHERAESLNSIRIIPFPKTENRLLRLLCFAPRITWLAYAERATLYHFHDPELLPWACLLQLITRRPVVYDMREYHSDAIRTKYWIPRILRHPLARIYNLLETFLLKHLAAVVTVNEDLAERVSLKGGRALSVPNFAPRSLFENPTVDTTVGARYSGRKILIYVGGLSAERGISEAIEAIDKLRGEFPSVLLLLVGKFHNPAYGLVVQKQIDRLNLTDHVELVGQVPHRAVPSYLAISDIALFLLQPVNERYNWGEPIKFFEYSAAGLPIVISDLPAKRRLIERIGNGILVDPTDVGEITLALARLLKDAKLRNKMGEQGQRAYLEEYNWEAVEGRLIDLYEKLTWES